MIINEDFFDEVEVQDAPGKENIHTESAGYDFVLGVDPQSGRRINVLYLKHCIDNIPNTEFDLENLVCKDNYVTVPFNSEIKTFKNLWIFFLAIYNGIGDYYVITVLNKNTQYETDAQMCYTLDMMSNPLKQIKSDFSSEIDYIADVASLVMKRIVRGKEISSSLNVNIDKHYGKIYIQMISLSRHYDLKYTVIERNKDRFYSSFENVLKVIQCKHDIKLVAIVDTLHNTDKLNVHHFFNNGINEDIPYYDIFQKQKRIIIDTESMKVCYNPDKKEGKFFIPVWRWFHSTQNDNEYDTAVDYILMITYDYISIKDLIKKFKNCVALLKCK